MYKITCLLQSAIGLGMHCVYTRPPSSDQNMLHLNRLSVRCRTIPLLIIFSYSVIVFFSIDSTCFSESFIPKGAGFVCCCSSAHPAFRSIYQHCDVVSVKGLTFR